MGQGFHVFKAVSPSSPCDLIAWKIGVRPVRIEVKSAARNINTGELLRPHSSRNIFDAICYVTRDQLIYEPPISTWSDLYHA